jgi:hypothetical protein
MRAALLPVIMVLTSGAALLPSDDPPVALAMTEPVACKKIRGFEDYDPLPNAVVVSGEKLLLYSRVTGHTIREEKGAFRAHLVEDVNIRKKGEKKVVWGRKKVVDFLADSKQPPERLYLGTTIALQGYRAGDYEAELILHDMLSPEATTTQKFEFKVEAAGRR